MCQNSGAVHIYDHLVGLEVEASTSEAEDLEFESRLRQDYSGSSHTIEYPSHVTSRTGFVLFCPVHKVLLNIFDIHFA